ncbi:MAG: hypothetical protein Q4G52_04395 [Clostridia bacterium]|nr:hypothetical protein [Clostridia bacterium]
MWWKLCRILSGLVAAALIILVGLKVKQWRYAEGVTADTNSQAEAVFAYPSHEVTPFYTAAPNDGDFGNEADQSVVYSETPEIEPNEERQMYAGAIRTRQYEWRDVYQKLSQYPNAKTSVSKGTSSTSVSNAYGEYFLIQAGGIYYSLNDSSNQLFELTSYPARATDMDRALKKEGEAALGVELDGMSREEAKKRAEEVLDSLFMSERYHAEAIDIYGYTGEDLRKIHKMLYQERDTWRYFYKDIPEEAENGLYYIEFQMCIDGVPVCSDEASLGIHYSIHSNDEILGTEMRMVLAGNRVVMLNSIFEFNLKDIQKVDMLSEEEIRPIVEEELNNTLSISNPEDFEVECMYLYVRHGTGKNANFELRPAWRVYVEGKNDEDYIAFFDAESGKILF